MNMSSVWSRICARGVANRNATSHQHIGFWNGGRSSSGMKSTDCRSFRIGQVQKKKTVPNYERPSTYPKMTDETKDKNSAFAAWGAVAVLGTIAVSYASVPLYRLFCQATGFGGTIQVSGDSTESPQFYTQVASTTARTDMPPIKITFCSDAAASMPWKFVPLQRQATVLVGETALAFYNAKNLTDEAITGVATYNVTPNKAGIYFNKIQCFCFEEQRLKPYEEIDMPVFFFIDPEFLDDPRMNDVTNITLSYTFFRAEDVDPAILQAQAASAWTPPSASNPVPVPQAA